jgi:hypothetical protein
MAKRPVFIVNESGLNFVDVELIEFEWVPGMAISQKQKSIASLHREIFSRAQSQPLEISGKSSQEIGVKLSAFNLAFEQPKDKKLVTVESAFQGSKFFEGFGSFPNLYEKSAREAKKFVNQLPNNARLERFVFYGQEWPLIPVTLFYDWLYVNTLKKNPELAKSVCEYDYFTDIEFNPKKSINCQAYSAALYVSLERRGLLLEATKEKDAFIDMLGSQPEWIMQTEYRKFHAEVLPFGAPERP